jgi:hypothetical protein
VKEYSAGEYLLAYCILVCITGFCLELGRKSVHMILGKD